jgi:dihydrolipoamide dehydrogenase
MTMNRDLVIIGAGPAGYSGAIRAAREGRQVVLVERDRAGGTCLNRGCIPTKALRRCADALLEARGAERFGVVLAGPPGFDYARAAAHRDEVTEALVSGVEGLLKAHKIQVLKGTGTIASPGRVVVETAAGTETIEAGAIVAATGSLPCNLPGITIDEDRILSSEGALRLNVLPERLIVIGAGVIGIEWADLMAAFGVKVSVVETMPRCLLNEDRATAMAVQKTLAARGVEFFFERTVSELTADERGVACVLSGGEQLRAERMIVSVGRRPALAGLGLAELGVELDRGAIKVDDRGRTTLPGLWAAGDAIGPPMLAHAAAHEMEVVVDNLLGRDRCFEREVIPAVVFIHPEVASVGLLEDRAKEQKLPVDVGRFAYAASGKARCEGETDGFAKVVVAKDGGRVLGGTVMGAHAAELVQELAVAIKSRLVVTDFIDIIHSHPTLSEIVLEAAADSQGLAIHKAGRKR